MRVMRGVVEEDSKNRQAADAIECGKTVLRLTFGSKSHTD